MTLSVHNGRKIETEGDRKVRAYGKLLPRKALAKELVCTMLGQAEGLPVPDRYFHGIHACEGEVNRKWKSLRRSEFQTCEGYMLQAGLVIQRTKPYKADLTIWQRCSFSCVS